MEEQKRKIEELELKILFQKLGYDLIKINY